MYQILFENDEGKFSPAYGEFLGVDEEYDSPYSAFNAASYLNRHCPEDKIVRFVVEEVNHE